jgi:general stress protein 26
MARAVDKMKDETASTEKKLDELYELIEGIEIAMMTTRLVDGSLVSRPMAVQKRRPGVDMWFMTTTDTHKVDELQAQPEVNLSFYRDRTREWVSVSGTARLDREPERIRRLYQKDWKAWLPDEGGDMDGGPGDPRIVLIEIDAHSAMYMKSNIPRPVALFRVAKAIVTGKPPKIGTIRSLDKRELDPDLRRDKAAKKKRRIARRRA